jgi:hypothetical protein
MLPLTLLTPPPFGQTLSIILVEAEDSGPEIVTAGPQG